jgi:PIN domain nuclease of toxin-antitoxin system
VKLLLDTHIWLWSVIEPARLAPRVAKALRDPGSELWVSPMSTLELVSLVSKGRIRLETELGSWVRSALRREVFRAAPLTHEVALRTESLGVVHRDPVDALLAATALVYELTLVTADDRLIRSGSCAVLPNR